MPILSSPVSPDLVGFFAVNPKQYAPLIFVYISSLISKISTPLSSQWWMGSLPISIELRSSPVTCRCWPRWRSWHTFVWLIVLTWGDCNETARITTLLISLLNSNGFDTSLELEGAMMKGDNLAFARSVFEDRKYPNDEIYYDLENPIADHRPLPKSTNP